MTNRFKEWSQRHADRLDLRTKARALESRLTDAFDKATVKIVGATPASPLEIVARAVDDVARHVHPSGRGRYAFPFNCVGITFLAPAAEDVARLEAICASPPSLQERIAKRLELAGCDAAPIDVSVSFRSEPDPAWIRPEFHVALSRVDAPPRPLPESSLRVELVVTHGSADRGSYSFSSLPIAIGRGAEVRDSRHQLIRINHVVFTEGGDDVTQSVSRRHARIELDELTRRPRLIDDNSAQGTSVIRNGRGIAVPRGSRGLGLQSGDEITLGQARIKVVIDSPRTPTS